MEQWKAIPGYEGIYEASDAGHIRSVPGKITRNARYDRREWKMRVLREKSDRRRGDRRVSLWRDGEEKTILVARAVALAWHGTPEDGMTVNHINGDNTDNRPQNLEWVTLADNIRKGYETGLYKRKCDEVTIISADGSTHTFRSKAETDRWLGRKRGYVSGAIKQGRRLRSAFGVFFDVLRV